MTGKNRVKVTVSFTVQREMFPGTFYDPQDFATFTGLWDSIKYVFRGGAGHGYYPVKHTDVDRMIAILERYQKVHEKLTASEEESAVGDWESEGGAVSQFQL